MRAASTFAFSVLVVDGTPPEITVEPPPLAAAPTADALRFGTAGVGTTAHFTMAAIQKATGTKALMVTYRGGAPAVADLQAGVIDMMFELTPGLMPLIEQGVVSPLAVGSAKRVGALPEVPGMAEFADVGLGQVDINAWEALMAPAGTPDATAVHRATPLELREHDFAPGSMGPKVEAACRFVERTGGRAVIAALDSAEAALAGRAGTTIR